MTGNFPQRRKESRTFAPLLRQRETVLHFAVRIETAEETAATKSRDGDDFKTLN
jgi:hypothetical protein